MMITIDNKIIDQLKEYARQPVIEEDECIDDYAAGNVDDAYYKGISDGEQRLASWLLFELNIQYE